MIVPKNWKRSPNRCTTPCRPAFAAWVKGWRRRPVRCCRPTEQKLDLVNARTRDPVFARYGFGDLRRAEDDGPTALFPTTECASLMNRATAFGSGNPFQVRLLGTGLDQARQGRQAPAAEVRSHVQAQSFDPPLSDHGPARSINSNDDFAFIQVPT